MTLEEIKQIHIREYLQKLGINPIRSNDRYGMYHSPFREDKDASMKVDYNQNLWIDYGIGEGGTIIDLVMRINNVSLNEAITSLNQHDKTTIQQPNSFSFHRNNTSNKQESEIIIRKIQVLSNPALLEFLKERKIPIDIATLHCKDVYYSVNDKPYFAVGFKNDTGGYALRNKYFKGCTSSDITRIRRNTDSCLLFEGFIDFLSYLTLKKDRVPEYDTIVLNSVNNLSKAKNTLSEYRTITAFLDNDEGGKRAIQDLRTFHKGVQDQSVHYANRKDLNDYLCSRFAPKQAIKKAPSRGRKM